MMAISFIIRHVSWYHMHRKLQTALSTYWYDSSANPSSFHLFFTPISFVGCYRICSFIFFCRAFLLLWCISVHICTAFGLVKELRRRAPGTTDGNWCHCWYISRGGRGGTLQKCVPTEVKGPCKDQFWRRRRQGWENKGLGWRSEEIVQKASGNESGMHRGNPSGTWETAKRCECVGWMTVASKQEDAARDTTLNVTQPIVLYWCI